MDLRFVLLLQDLFVIIFLSYRERCFPIKIRRCCRICIGAFPLGFNPDGFSRFWFDFGGLRHYRGHDYDLPFSKLRRDLQTRTWDPGDSIYNTGNGGLRQCNGHTDGRLLEFVLAMGILVLPRSETSLFLCTDMGIFSHLMFLSFGIRELLWPFRTRDITLGFEDVMTMLLFDQLDAMTRKFVLSSSHLFATVPNKYSFLEASVPSMRRVAWRLYKAMFFTHPFCISGRIQMEKEIAISLDSTDKRTMATNEHK